MLYTHKQHIINLFISTNKSIRCNHLELSSAALYGELLYGELLNGEWFREYQCDIFKTTVLLS